MKIGAQQQGPLCGLYQHRVGHDTRSSSLPDRLAMNVSLYTSMAIETSQGLASSVIPAFSRQCHQSDALSACPLAYVWKGL